MEQSPLIIYSQGSRDVGEGAGGGEAEGRPRAGASRRENRRQQRPPSEGTLNDAKGLTSVKDQCVCTCVSARARAGTKGPPLSTLGTEAETVHLAAPVKPHGGGGTSG